MLTNDETATLVGDEALLNALSELDTRKQYSLLIGGLQKSAKPILDSVKNGYQFGGSDQRKIWAKQFRIRKSRKKELFVAVVAQGGRAVWVNNGTKARKTKGWGTVRNGQTKEERQNRKRWGVSGDRVQFKAASRGKINQEQYFEDAVERNSQSYFNGVSAMVQQNIQKYLQRQQNG